MTARARSSSAPPRSPRIGPTVWGSEGDKSETIKQTVPWDESTSATFQLPLDAGRVKFPAITQEGQAVFRWAVFEMAKVAQQALDAAGITADDLDVFIPHQANMRIIDSMVKTLKLPEHVTVARDVRDHRQHLGRLDPARDGAAPGDRAGEERRHRARHRLRGGSRLRRDGRYPPLGTPCRITSSGTGDITASTPSETHRRSANMAATQEEIVAGLAEIVNEIAGIPVEDVQLDKSFTDDLDVDSLSMVEVVVAAEERFDVKIPDDDVKNLKTVGDADRLHPQAPGLIAPIRPGLTAPPPGGGAADIPRITWRKNSRELDQSHRGRHRYRRNHTAGWRQRIDLGGSDRRTFRCQAPGAGVGRRTAGPYRRPGRRGPDRGHSAAAGPQAGPLGAVRADRGPGGVGGRRLHRRRPARTRPSTRTGSARSSPPASAA